MSETPKSSPSSETKTQAMEAAAKAIWPEAFAGDGAGWHQRRDVARWQARAAVTAYLDALAKDPPSELVGQFGPLFRGTSRQSTLALLGALAAFAKEQP